MACDGQSARTSDGCSRRIQSSRWLPSQTNTQLASLHCSTRISSGVSGHSYRRCRVCRRQSRLSAEQEVLMWLGCIFLCHERLRGNELSNITFKNAPWQSGEIRLLSRAPLQGVPCRQAEVSVKAKAHKQPFKDKSGKATPLHTVSRHALVRLRLGRGCTAEQSNQQEFQGGVEFWLSAVLKPTQFHFARVLMFSFSKQKKSKDSVAGT